MNQVAKKENAGALSSNIFEADANAGSQNISQEDLALPFLKVLGQLSPEVNKKNSKYVKGAEPGMIINTVTTDIYDGEKGINVVPVFYKRQYIEWQDRGESSGAPVQIYEAGDDVPQTTRDKSNKDRLPNGNYLENTASHFVIVVSGNAPSTALISMKATQLKISRKWNSMMMGLRLQGKNGLFTPPTYSHIYNLKTIQMTNDKGTWYGWDVTRVGPVADKGVYDQAKLFSTKVGKGEIKAKHGSEEPKPVTPF
jgi:hypothetical protein